MVNSVFPDKSFAVRANIFQIWQPKVSCQYPTCLFGADYREVDGRGNARERRAEGLRLVSRIYPSCTRRVHYCNSRQ